MMFPDFFRPIFPNLFFMMPFLYGGFILLAIWSLFWKFQALWRAAHRNEKKWFIALLLINTLGILEILYLQIWGSDKQASK